jgi:transcriptional regulator with XRE-family HTH domain
MHILELIRKNHGLKRYEMAARLGITRPRYTQIVSTANPVSPRVALKAYQEFGAPLEVMLSNPVVEGHKAC